MISNKKIELARENWIRASRDMGFKLVTPYFLEINTYKKKEAFAFLTDYGSPNGIVVSLISAPKYETDGEIIEFTKRNNLQYSFVNVESHLVYNEDSFREILEDWSQHKD